MGAMKDLQLRLIGIAETIQSGQVYEGVCELYKLAGVEGEPSQWRPGMEEPVPEFEPEFDPEPPQSA